MMTAIVWYLIGALVGLTIFLLAAEAFRDAARLERRLVRRFNDDIDADEQ